MTKQEIQAYNKNYFQKRYYSDPAFREKHKASSKASSFRRYLEEKKIPRRKYYHDYYIKNKERKSAYNKKYYREHKAEILAQSKKYFKERYCNVVFREKRKEYYKNYRVAKKAKRLASALSISSP